MWYCDFWSEIRTGDNFDERDRKKIFLSVGVYLFPSVSLWIRRNILGEVDFFSAVFCFLFWTFSITWERSEE